MSFPRAQTLSLGLVERDRDRDRGRGGERGRREGQRVRKDLEGVGQRVRKEKVGRHRELLGHWRLFP